MFSSYAVIYRRILLSWSARLLSGSSLSSVVCLLVLCFVRDRDRDRPCVSVRLLSVLHSVRDQSECVPNATMSKRVSQRYPDFQSAYTCMLFLLILPTIGGGGGGGVSWRFVRPTWRRWRASSVFIFELFFTCRVRLTVGCCVKSAPCWRVRQRHSGGREMKWYRL